MLINVLKMEVLIARQIFAEMLRRKRDIPIIIFGLALVTAGVFSGLHAFKHAFTPLAWDIFVAGIGGTVGYGLGWRVIKLSENSFLWQDLCLNRTKLKYCFVLFLPSIAVVSALLARSDLSAVIIELSSYIAGGTVVTVIVLSAHHYRRFGTRSHDVSGLAADDRQSLSAAIALWQSPWTKISPAVNFFLVSSAGVVATLAGWWLGIKSATDYGPYFTVTVLAAATMRWSRHDSALVRFLRFEGYGPYSTAGLHVASLLPLALGVFAGALVYGVKYWLFGWLTIAAVGVIAGLRICYLRITSDKMADMLTALTIGAAGCAVVLMPLLIIPFIGLLVLSLGRTGAAKTWS